MLLAGLDAFIARCDHLYLTIDLDVLPGAVMLGEARRPRRGAGGHRTLIAHIRASGKPRLADLAEYNPNLDQDNPQRPRGRAPSPPVDQVAAHRA